MFISLISGFVMGSFYNVVGFRLPISESFIYPQSHCPNCNNDLIYFDNIPVISYLLLKGKCRFCKVNISIIYPMVELFTGLLFMFAVYKMEEFNLFVSLALISFIIIITITDLYYFIIPNKILLFFLSLFILLRIIYPLDPWYESVIGFLISYVIVFILIVLSRGGIGAGDLKLLAVLGFLTGTKIVLLGFILAILFGGLYGFGLLLFKRKNKGDYIPFGPFIGVSILISFYYHERIINLYITEILKL